MRFAQLVRSTLVAVLVAGLFGCTTDKPGGVSGGGYKVGNPYQIAGVWYYPKEDPFYDETGIASWYGQDFHGNACIRNFYRLSGVMTDATFTTDEQHRDGTHGR